MTPLLRINGAGKAYPSASGDPVPAPPLFTDASIATLKAWDGCMIRQINTFDRERVMRQVRDHKE